MSRMLDEQHIDVNLDLAGGAARRTAQQLSTIDHIIVSRCGDIKVKISGNGTINRIAIRPGTLDRRRAEDVSAALTSTIQQAETLLIEALAERRDNREADR